MYDSGFPHLLFYIIYKIPQKFFRSCEFSFSSRLGGWFPWVSHYLRLIWVRYFFGEAFLRILPHHQIAPAPFQFENRKAMCILRLLPRRSLTESVSISPNVLGYGENKWSTGILIEPNVSTLVKLSIPWDAMRLEYLYHRNLCFWYRW